jgi:cellulose biosynthesis protein BcsQ
MNIEYVFYVFPVCGLLLVIFLWFKKKYMKFIPLNHVKIYTFANHKGGVGKSTMAFFTMKEFVRRYPHKKCLIIDGSTSGDLTKLCFGPMSDGSKQVGEKALKAQCTIEHLVRKLKNRWVKTNMEEHIFPIHQVCDKAPTNLYIMTNEKQSNNNVFDRMHELDDMDISNVCAKVRKGLSNRKDEWVILVDTDGGEMHDFTRLGICLADHIIIPLSAFMGAENDAWRLDTLFQYTQKLRNDGLTKAMVSYVFFNNLKSHHDKECELSPFGHRGSFTPGSDAKKSISIVIQRFEKWIKEYPELLFPMKQIHHFGMIRMGGKEFNSAITEPWEQDAGNVQCELEKLVDVLVEDVSQNFQTPQKK